MQKISSFRQFILEIHRVEFRVLEHPFLSTITQKQVATNMTGPP